MKRIFTLVALLAISANLALANYTHGGVALKPQKASPFECDEHTENAETKTYSTQTMKNDMGMISMHDGQILKVCFFDDGTVWFHNPFFLNPNNFPEKQKLIGTIDETGLITIPMHQIVYSFNDDVSGEQRDVKVSRCTIENDEYGNSIVYFENTSDVYTLQLDKETGIITSIEKDVCLCQYETTTPWYTVMGNITATPWVGEEVVVPEGATYHTYSYTYEKDYIEGAKVVDVAFTDTECYICGLVFDGAWVRGEIDGNIIRMPSYQFQGIHNNQSVTFAAGEYLGENPVTGATEYGPLDSFEFRMSNENKTFKARAGQTPLLLAGKTVVSIYEDVKLNEFTEVPATPATPVITYGQVDSQWAGLEFNIAWEDVDGNFINPENMTWTIFIDDEPYTFEPGIYYIEEPITEFPYVFNDLNGGTDLYTEGQLHRVFIYGELFETMGVEVYYTAGGERRTSERAIFNSNSIDNINSSTDIVNTIYYDLNGREIKNPDNGLYIKRVFYSDGTIRHTKQIIRK